MKIRYSKRGKKIGATLIAILIISIVTLTVAYAALSETLSIQGSAKVNASNWNIKLNNSTTKTNSTTGTATYKHTKDAIAVQKGDVVTYTIRVYNEGEVDGYVDKITDYLPNNLIPIIIISHTLWNP